MDELYEFFERIDNSFLLNIGEKEQLKRFIKSKSKDYDFKELDNLLNEKAFIRSFLESLLTQNTKDITYIEISNNMKAKYLKQIRELEKSEKENVDQIFVNFF